jgi:hypothetical protein
MGALCRNCAVFVVLCFAADNAWATSKSTDQSDLWFNASESGWGMQLVQRDNTIFATLFVYGPNNQPTWYVSTMQASSDLTWTDPLYSTTGPWFGTIPFNASSVTVAQVGSMTWSAPFVNSGTVTYTVNGVTVTKEVVRQLAVLDDFSGTFGGAFHGTATSCSSSANNVTAETYAAFAVTQSGQSVSVGLAFESGATCTFPGTLTQSGQFGTMSGNYSCSSGEAGAFILSEMNVGINFWNTRVAMSSTNNGCQTTGYFGGIRHR